MSSDSQLYISTEIAWREVFKVFLAEFGLTLADQSTDPERSEWPPSINGRPERSGEVDCPGFIAICGSPVGYWEGISEAYQIKRCTVFIDCALLATSSLDYNVILSSALQGMIAVLRRVPGDAAFVMDGERAVLVRRNGKLILDSQFDTWRPRFPERLSWLEGIPFTQEVLPFIGE